MTANPNRPNSMRILFTLVVVVCLLLFGLAGLGESRPWSGTTGLAGLDTEKSTGDAAAVGEMVAPDSGANHERRLIER